MKNSLMKDSCTKRQYFQGGSTPLLDKASHLTTLRAWDSSPHLSVTPVQLMRPGIGQNAIMYAKHNIYIFREDEVCCSCVVNKASPSVAVYVNG